MIKNFDLSKSTWFQTGGKADLYCNVYDKEDLKIIIKNIPSNIPIFVLGAGSNILVRDGGFKGLIIKLGKGFNNITIKNGKLFVGPSVLDNTLSKFALKNSISNLEFFSGIPGTLGGAIKMNAGCFGFETKDVVLGSYVLDRLGKEIFLDNSNLNFNYRSSVIDDNSIVTEIVIRIDKGNIENINSKIQNIIEKRNLTQPLKTKTGGSTFKNPIGFYSAKLIEESGCKNMQVGGAIVSSKHSNFIINQNNASAEDIENLGKKIIEKVYSKFNIILDWEIKIIGSSRD